MGKVGERGKGCFGAIGLVADIPISSRAALESWRGNPLGCRDSRSPVSNITRHADLPHYAFLHTSPQGL